MERHNNNNAIAMPNIYRTLTIMRHSHDNSKGELRGNGQHGLVGVEEVNQLRGVFFTAMEELDGDDVRVSFRGRYAERDIVQVDLIKERKSWS